MKKNYLIKNATIVNEGISFEGHLAIKDGLIHQIFQLDEPMSQEFTSSVYQQVEAKGLHLLPGVIDDQVHFREPGLTYKGDIYTESRAAVAGGITSFMEMPNTIPNTLSNELLEEKFALAAEKSLANYSFYLGASNNNLSEIEKVNPQQVCGIKVFMGSSTGNMLVDDQKALEAIFVASPILVATHCEDETTVQSAFQKYRALYPMGAPASVHPLIRSAEACYASSSRAVELAAKHNTRLHVLHLSSAAEMSLFTNDRPLAEKQITAEVCIHHLWFNEHDYAKRGNFIKWNPSVKSRSDQEALWEALRDGRLDVVATDHAPHSFEEKSRPYFESPSGGPLVQHALPAMLDFYLKGMITLEEIVQRMAHNPAIAFNIIRRGFIRQGYHADLVLVDLNKPSLVEHDKLRYKCGWSPFEGHKFGSSVKQTFVNGNLVFEDDELIEGVNGMRLLFNR